jgi:hypothetical protein
MDKEQLYNRLDEDEELTDEEKREIYFTEIAFAEEEERWKENNGP